MNIKAWNYRLTIQFNFISKKKNSLDVKFGLQSSPKYPIGLEIIHNSMSPSHRHFLIVGFVSDATYANRR